MNTPKMQFINELKRNFVIRTVETLHNEKNKINQHNESNVRAFFPTFFMGYPKKQQQRRKKGSHSIYYGSTIYSVCYIPPSQAKHARLCECIRDMSICAIFHIYPDIWCCATFLLDFLAKQKNPFAAQSGPATRFGMCKPTKNPCK